MTRDHKGVAAFIGHGPNNDIPMVGQSMGAVEVPLAVSAVGFRINNEDARQYRYGQRAELGTDLGGIGAQAAENLKEVSVIFGSEIMNFLPWINYPGVPVIQSPSNDEPTPSTRWSDKSPMQKMETLNLMPRAMWEETKTLYKVTDIYMPMDIFANATETLLALDGGPLMATTVMAHFKANNINNSIPGASQIRVWPSRYLGTAGADGKGRMVAMCRSPKHQVWPSPFDYTVGQPVPEPLGAAWYGEQKFGSYHVRQIGTMMYMDGI